MSDFYSDNVTPEDLATRQPVEKALQTLRLRALSEGHGDHRPLQERIDEIEEAADVIREELRWSWLALIKDCPECGGRGVISGGYVGGYQMLDDCSKGCAEIAARLSGLRNQKPSPGPMGVNSG